MNKTKYGKNPGRMLLALLSNNGKQTRATWALPGPMGRLAGEV